MLKLPRLVGVPESTPPRSVNPSGRGPEATLNVYGAIPPLAVNVVVGYGVHTVPFGRASGDTMMGPQQSVTLLPSRNTAPCASNRPEMFAPACRVMSL